MEATIEDNLAAFNTAFAEYLGFTSKQPQEALERKVHNIGIRLFEGFRAVQFGGYPRNRGIAEAQLQARTAAGRGTKVRPELLARYQAARNDIMAERRALRKKARWGTLTDWSAAQSGLAALRKKAISLWQSVVGEEIKERQSGIGELAASFLPARYRGKGEARRIVTNRQGHPIGSVDVGPGVAVITGMVAGLTTVDARYGIVAKAIAEETAEFMGWMKDQQDKAGERL